MEPSQTSGSASPPEMTAVELDAQQRYLRQHNISLEIDRIVGHVLETTPKEPLAVLEKAFRARAKPKTGAQESSTASVVSKRPTSAARSRDLPAVSGKAVVPPETASLDPASPQPSSVGLQSPAE